MRQQSHLEVRNGKESHVRRYLRHRLQRGRSIGTGKMILLFMLLDWARAYSSYGRTKRATGPKAENTHPTLLSHSTLAAVKCSQILLSRQKLSSEFIMHSRSIAPNDGASYDMRPTCTIVHMPSIHSSSSSPTFTCKYALACRHLTYATP